MRRAGRITAVLAGVCIALGFSLKTAPGPVRAQSLSGHDQLWEAYAGRFISGDGRVVDPMRGDLTTSEGQSYALFFALVNNDRTRFDLLFKWTSANLAAGDLGEHLPAWEWGKGKDGHWGVLDVNSAADSDLWIAYDLLQAGRLWNEKSYTQLGMALAAQIVRSRAGEIELHHRRSFSAAILRSTSSRVKTPLSHRRLSWLVTMRSK